jgi:hypothetical protein
MTKKPKHRALSMESALEPCDQQLDEQPGEQYQDQSRQPHKNHRHDRGGTNHATEATQAVVRVTARDSERARPLYHERGGAGRASE